MSGKNDIVAGIRLEGEKEFKDEVTSINKSLTSMKSELNKTSAEYDGQANTLEALTKKQEILNKILEEQKKKVSANEAGLKHARESYDNVGKGLEKLYTDLEKATTKLKDINNIYGEGSEEAKQQQAEVDRLSAAIGRGETNYQKTADRCKDWETKLNTAETQVIKATKAVNQNAEYMKEAEEATDGCAKSIDKFGKKANDAGKITTGLGEKVKTALVNEGAKIGADALKKVLDTAKQAAKYTVEVGSSFESAMSEVAAISGATGDELDAMEEKAKELGSTTKFSATEAAEAFKYMSLAGWSTSDMLSGIDGVMNLAAASGMDLAAASDMVTDYLSAFGLEAKDSAHMADLMAYAQANSNTSAQQLGEAYQNCGANLNSAGQDIETVTSLLEGMANQGTKGSKAGTQLSAIMRDITKSMKDGKIAIGDTAIEVMDAQGNYRDLTDILSEVEKATENLGTAEKNTALSSSFTADSITGLNLILNEGMGKISGYETALRNSDGTAKTMADTMQDNLGGKLTEMNSALEGLGIAAYDYIDGPLKSAVETVTGIIGGITDLITPHKTELETLIEETKDARKEVENTIEAASKITADAETEAEKVGILGEQLISLNGIEDKTLGQKYRMNELVNQLSKSIPELANAYNEEAGKVNLSDEAIRKLIGSTKDLMMAQAMQQAMQEEVNALANSTVALEKAKIAEDALKTESEFWDSFGLSMRELNDEFIANSVTAEDYAAAIEDAQNRLTGAMNNGTITTEEYEGAMEALEKRGEGLDSILTYAGDKTVYYTTEAGKATDETQKLAKAQEELQKGYDQTEKAVENLMGGQKKAEETTGKTIPTLNETANAVTHLGSSYTDTGDKIEEAGKKMEASAQTQKTAFRDVWSTYESTVKQIEADIQKTINPFEKFDPQKDKGEDVTVESMTKNLNSQIEAFENYEKNLAAVKDHVGEEISPEFMRYIENMGMDGANMLEHILTTFADQEPEKVKELNDKWMQAMDQTENIAKAGAANEIAIKASMGELGSTEFEFSDLKDSIKKATSDANGAWKDLPDGTRTALEQAVAAAQEMGIKIPEGLASGISSGEIAPEDALAQLNGSMQGRFDGLAKIAQEQGSDVPKMLADGIASGEMSVQEAYGILLDALAAQATQAREKGEEIGKETAGGAQAGVEDGASGVEQAASDMASSGATAADEKRKEYNDAGNMAASEYANGLRNGKQYASSAGTALSSAAKQGVESQTGFYGAGVNMAAGVAQGISDGASRAVSAAASMAREALAAAKREADIHSPSGKFRREFGHQVSAGAAFGIKDKASLAGKAASQMSNKVYTNAVNWLKKYKKSQQVSLEDEKYYWQQVLKHTKSGTSAYKKAMSQLDKVVGQQIGSTELAGQINKNFGVSKTTGSGKKKKTKDADTYYSEIYSAAEKYMRNYQVLNNVSLQQEEAYWQQVKSKLKSKTQAWYDATAKIKDLQKQQIEAEAELKEQQAQKAKDALTTRANVQDSILEKYRTYYKVSAKAEADYWDKARRQFNTGTDERIEADKKYFDALQNLYDERKKLDEDYAQNSKEINDKLKDDIKDLQDAYKDAVNSRKDDILSQMNLFEAWDSSGYDADTLLYNLKTQVAGLTLWEQQLEELGKKGLTAGLMEELKAMGPDAAASIYSLNQMTAEQLTEYNKLWTQKNNLAESQAVKDNEGLRQDTNKQITQLRLDAQAELNALNAEYRAAISELYSGMAGDLANLVNKAGGIGEDAVSGLIAGIGKAANSVETYNSTTQVVNTLTEQLQALKQEGSVIGKSTLDGLLAGLADNVKIENASKEVIQSIKRAMEEEAEIHSPARLFRRETGPQIPAGVAEGMEDGTVKAVQSSKSMVRRMLEAANSEMDRQQNELQMQAASLDYSGIGRLNRALEGYKPQSTVINVDNTGVLKTMEGMMQIMGAILDKVGTGQVVLDKDTLVGELRPAMSQAMAWETVRKSGGRR